MSANNNTITNKCAIALLFRTSTKRTNRKDDKRSESNSTCSWNTPPINRHVASRRAYHTYMCILIRRTIVGLRSKMACSRYFRIQGFIVFVQVIARGIGFRYSRRPVFVYKYCIDAAHEI